MVWRDLARGAGEVEAIVLGGYGFRIIVEDVEGGALRRGQAVGAAPVDETADRVADRHRIAAMFNQRDPGLEPGAR